MLPAPPIFGGDVLVANYFDGTVSRHRFDGGAWGRVGTIAVGPSPHGFAVADLNRDGRADLIVTNRDDAEITIRYQDSDAGFDPPVSVGVGPGPLWVAVGPLNGDLWPDLVTANLDVGGFTVLFGSAQGFSAARTFATSGAIHHVEIAELTGDGISDLVLANNGQGRVELWAGLADAGFEERLVLDAGLMTRSVVVRDVTGDGRADIVAVSRAANTADIYPRLSDGGFGRFTLATGSAPMLPLVGDLSGDGRPDLVVPQSSGVASVFIATSQGSFAAPFAVDAGQGPYGAFMFDFDFDGDLDIFVTEFDAASVTVLRRNGCDQP
ncbi:MAG: VCBS repeat-containing protein [Myxococcaceae bacterium]|nr:VCBS repeat-containing protein [Myxococcaceae bacterium]